MFFVFLQYINAKQLAVQGLPGAPQARLLKYNNINNISMTDSILIVGR